MKNLLLIPGLILLFICSFSCSSDDGNGNINNGSSDGDASAKWSIPLDEVFDGGPGKDGIPALVNPAFSPTASIDFLKDSDLVLVFKNGDDIRAYPHVILDWHEIINDNIGDVSVAITYCPLTGTGIGWSRILDDEETTFGVSGLLYNSNLIPYDRATDSNWSQLLNEAVNGELIGEKADVITLFETDWKTFRTLFPDSRVVNTQTGFSRTYGTSPYGNYADSDVLLFPVFPNDQRLPLKERVHVIIDENNAKVYRFESLTANNNLIRDSFQGNDYIITGNNNFIVSFQLSPEITDLEFEYIYNETEALLRDNEGNEWNIFGEALSGPRAGQSLLVSTSLMAYWFSITPFYGGSGVAIYGR